MRSLRRLFSFPLLGLALAALMLTACGPNGQTGDATATPAPTEMPPATNTPVTPPVGEASPVPGMPDNLCAEPPTVSEFLVWQDFMPIVPRDGAPLRAALTIEMQCPPDVAPADIQGKITLRRDAGEEILVALLQVDGIEDTATAGVRRIFMSMQAAPPPMTLTEGESISGTAILTIDGQQIEIQLPETPLQFTH